MRKRLSYANITATLALVFAMSGGAMAANSYLINSTKQINPKVLKKLAGKPGKTGNAGANGATGSAGATGATGPQGPGGKEGIAGKEGKEGPKGETGSPGTSGYQIVEGNIAKGTESGFNLATSVAKCPSGKSLLGGGFHVTTGEDTKIFVADNGPNGSTEWEARLTSGSTSGYSAVAYAICATVSS
jgi:hypothetical protein